MASREPSTETLIAFVDDDVDSLDAQLEEPVDPGAGRVAERYEILGLLGVGGMGSVYKVRDLELDEVVALKRLRRELADRPGALARFRQEVKLARRVTHPNVVRTFDLGEQGDERFLTMEYVEGRALSQLLAVEGALPPARAIPIALQICAGLSAAHRAGVLHRDLKPDNVLLGSDGRVVLTDFGIAAAAAEVVSGPVGGLLGTPAYVAPELVSGTAPVDARADQYALGALLFEMLTGCRAWPGEDPMEVARARLNRPPPHPQDLQPTLSGELALVIMRCLATDPRDRFADVEAVASALAERQGSRPPAPAPLPSAGSGAGRRMPEPGAQSVAVLPLRSASDDDAWVAEGLTEELIDALSMTPGLRVRPLAAVCDLVAGDPREAGRRLGAEAVVTGAVRRAGDDLRVSVRLVSVADGYQVWARRATCPPSSALALSDTLAAGIAGALTAELRGTPRDEGMDPAALELYLRGRAELRTNWHLGLDEAIELLSQARTLVPEHPSVLAAYATAQARRAFPRMHGREAMLADALQAAERAVDRGPQLGEPWMALATVRLYQGDSAGAYRSVRTALDRAPGLARAHEVLGMLLLEAGLRDEAESSLLTALSLDPGARQPRWELGRLYALEGQWDRADATIGAQIHDDPDAAFAQALVRARTDFWQGREPRVDLEPFRASDRPQALIISQVVGMLTDVLRHRRVEPQHESYALQTVGHRAGRQRWVVLQIFAEVCAFLDLTERAFGFLDDVVADGLQDLSWIDSCPVIAPLRSDPRFAPLRAQVAARAAGVGGSTSSAG